MLATLFLLAVVTVDAPSDRWLIQLRSGETLHASGPVQQDGSRTIFRVGTRVYSVASDEIANISERSVDTSSEPPPPETPHEAPRSRTLLVDPRTAEKILNSIAPAAEDSPAARAGSLPAAVSYPPPSPDAPDPADEHYWRERWREAHDRLVYAREDLALLIDREQRLNDEILGLLSLGFHESQMGRQVWQLQNTRDAIQRAKLEITRAEREMNRVIIDARREGVYPSWLRE